MLTPRPATFTPASAFARPQVLANALEINPATATCAPGSRSLLSRAPSLTAASPSSSTSPATDGTFSERAQVLAIGAELASGSGGAERWAREVPVAYLLFDGEQHGFRRAENIRRALDAELSFYAQVFGFELPADEGIEPVTVENAKKL